METTRNDQLGVQGIPATLPPHIYMKYIYLSMVLHNRKFNLKESPLWKMSQSIHWL